MLLKSVSFAIGVLEWLQGRHKHVFITITQPPDKMLVFFSRASIRFRGKIGKTAVLPGFCGIERGSGCEQMIWLSLPAKNLPWWHYCMATLLMELNLLFKERFGRCLMLA